MHRRALIEQGVNLSERRLISRSMKLEKHEKLFRSGRCIKNVVSAM